jgi:hypothetical protein
MWDENHSKLIGSNNGSMFTGLNVYWQKFDANKFFRFVFRLKTKRRSIVTKAVLWKTMISFFLIIFSFGPLILSLMKLIRFTKFLVNFGVLCIDDLLLLCYLLTKRKRFSYFFNFFSTYSFLNWNINRWELFWLNKLFNSMTWNIRN